MSGRTAGPARPAESANLTPTRSRLLAHLRQAAGPLGVDAVAGAVGLHPNSVRTQLERLVADGLVVRERRAPTGRGRPAWQYRAQPGEPDAGQYRGLASALVAHLAATSAEPQIDGYEAGLRWGRAMALPGDASTGRGVRQQVVDLLAKLAFGPAADRNCRSVTLTTCPLLDVARQHPDVVCQVHRGLVAGVLAEAGAPHSVELRPFAGPAGCALTMNPG